jgi:hypothetical protein
MARDSLHGYLVVWERHHHLAFDGPYWEFLGFAVSFHYAELMATDWSKGHDPYCEDCQKESVARIFEVPSMEDYYTNEKTRPTWRQRLG